MFYDRPNRCRNEELFYLIDAISSAISKGKKISFQYATRVLTAERTLGEKIKDRTVSPYAMTWQDDHYYLICNYEKYDNLLNLRIDRMHGVTVLSEDARPFCEVSPYREVFDVADYTGKLFGMYTGSPEKITLQCDKNIIEQVVDRFSEKIFITNVDENTFSFSTEAVISDALVTWLMHYGDTVRVLAPPRLKEQIVARAEKVLALYQKEL